MLHSKYGGLCGQGVKAGLQLYKVHSTALQGRYLLRIDLHHIVKGILAEGQVRCVRRKRQGLACWAHASGNVYAAGGRVGGLASYARRGVRHLRGLRHLAVLLLAYPVRAKAVGLYDVRSGFNELLVYGAYQVRVVQVQGLVVANEMPLDHSAHCTVQNQYPVLEILSKRHRPRSFP